MVNHRKGYATAEEAMRSKAYLTTLGATVELCPCTRYHVNVPTPPRSPMKARRDTGPSAAVRETVLKRDRWCCLRCGKVVVGRAKSIHHRKLRSQGGRHDPENLITLCGTGTLGCHGWVHSHVAESLASGWLVLSTDDPALVSVLVISEGGSGADVWLLPDGGRATEAPEERAA